MFDFISEIVSTIRRNKLRTALTGFAVAWGIFILIVLLGAGNGVIHAFEERSSQRALNSVKVFPGWASKPFEGLKDGRYVRLDYGDLDLTKSHFPDNVDEIGAYVTQSGCTVSYGSEYISVDLDGHFPNETKISGIKMVEGRYINDIDIRDCRKVIIINETAKSVLFGDSEPLGHFVNAGDVAYKVVGVFKSDGQNSEVHIPFTTLRVIYGKGSDLYNYAFTTKGLETQEANDAFESELRKTLGQKHHFASDDYGAVWFWNRMSNYLQASQAMNILSVAIWVIGIFTLVSGIVGVSNIMLITVKERTREFGIRKALSAKSRSILALVLAESVAITTFFGYVGMVAGIGVTELASSLIDGDGEAGGGMVAADVFTNPTVDLSIAVEATLALIVAGTIAGFVPARKAVKIRPIEALRAD